MSTLASNGDRRKLALIYERAATYRWLEDELAALKPLEVAIQLLADLPPGRELAMVLHAYAAVLSGLGPMSEARPYLDRALQVCRSAQSPTDEVKILRDLGDCALHEGDIDTGMLQHARAAELAEQHDDHLGATGVAYRRAEALLLLGRLDEAAAMARAGLEAARRAGLEQHANAEMLSCRHFEALAELGRPGEAESVAQVATESTPASSASLARAHLDLLAGDLTAATTQVAAI